jgi:hypothetical protein
VTEIARLQIAVDASQVPKGTKNLAGLEQQSKKTEAAVKNAGSAVKAFVGALAIGATITKVIAATVEQERVTAQLEATLKSTGRYTPELSANLQAMAGELQGMTAFGDEAIISMQALLLTFTQIGGENFNRAQSAILDVATAMGTDLKSAAIQVGKALNDPVLGVSALARSGIQFTDSQKDVIKSLVDTGRAAEAQAIILKELELQFGGSAEAARNTLGGALQALQNAFGDLLEGDSGPSGVTDSVNELTKTLSDPQVKAAFGAITSAVLDLASTVASALPVLFDFTRWAAEELAASVGGIAGDDIDRLSDKLGRLERQAGEIQAAGKDRPQWLTDELSKYGNLLQEAYKSQEQLAAAPDPVKPEVPALIAAASTATGKLTAAQKEAVKAAEKVTQAQRDNDTVVSDLTESLYQASLGAEALAQRQASLQLNKYATTEQVASVKQLSAALYEAEAAEKARAEVKAQSDKGVSDMPGGGALPFEVGGLSAEQMRLITEAEQLALWRATELENQRVFLEAGALSEQEYATRVEQIKGQSNSRTQQINFASQQVQLAAAENLFSSLTGLTAQFAGEQSGAYKAMFLVQKAAGVAQSLVAINTGIAMAAANPFPFNLAAIASVAAATAGLVSNVSSVTASFEGGGFTGNGARSGGLDGKGGFMAMMHPQETVTDHTKGQQMPGGGGVTVNVIESKDKAGTQQTTTGADGTEQVDVFVSDIFGDGPRSRAMQSAFGLQRAGR